LCVCSIQRKGNWVSSLHFILKRRLSARKSYIYMFY